MRLILLLLTFIASLYAEVIDNYELSFNVGQDSIDAREVIDYNFEGNRRHGIFRDIPTKIKANGKIVNLHFKDFKVTQNGYEAKYQKYYRGSDIVLKIGSNDSFVSGKVRYEIIYKFNTPLISKDKYDLISLNLIGTKWQVPIKYAKVYLRVNPPLYRGNINIKLYTGIKGSTSNKAKYEWVDNQNLEIEVKNLKPKEGVTIDIMAQKGLIKQNKSYFNYFNILIGALIAILLFLIKRVKDKILGISQKSISPTFLPPNDLSILEAKVLLEGSNELKDISAQIVQLATLGVIKIEKLGDVTKFDLINNDFSNLTNDQQMLLNTIFAKGNTYYFKRYDREFLRESFFEIFREVENELLNKGYLKDNPKKSKFRFFVNSILISLPLIAYFLYTLFQYNSDFYLLTLFPLVFGTVGLTIILNGSSIFDRFFGLVFFLTGLLPIYINLGIQSRDFLGIIKETLSYDITWPLLGLIILGSYIFSNIGKIEELTDKGIDKRVQLLGLKEFISRVEVDKINRLLQEDPNYLDNIIPWAMLFGYAKEFLKLYTIFNIATPTWYDGDISSLDDDLNSDINSYLGENKSGSNIGGDGGSSGDGAGGGGGGSW